MKKHLRRLTAGCLAVLMLPVNGFAGNYEVSQPEDEPVPEGLLAEPVPILPENYGMMQVNSLDLYGDTAAEDIVDYSAPYYQEQMEQKYKQMAALAELQDLLDSIGEGEEIGYSISLEDPDELAGAGQEEIPAEEDKKEEVVPPAEEDKKDEVVPPAEEDKNDGDVPPAEEDKNDGDVPPAEEDKNDGDVPPAEEDKNDGDVPPAEEDKNDGDVPPAEDGKQESNAPSQAEGNDGSNDVTPSAGGDVVTNATPSTDSGDGTGEDTSSGTETQGEAAASANGAVLTGMLAYSRSDPVNKEDSSNCVFANGIPITIVEERSQTKVKWDDGSVDVDSNTKIFGGSQTGDVARTEITFESGTVGQIFGGGLNGNVTGDTFVTVNGGTAGLIYGGGANGTVGGTANVTVNNGATVSTALYGGGCFSGASVGGTAVTINGGTLTSAPVYGGGQLGDVNGNTRLLINGGKISWAFGGGSNGSVTGSSTVDFLGGSVTNNLYGGGNAGTVGSTKVTVDGGTITGPSGGLGGVVAGGASAAAATTELTIRSDLKFACGGGHKSASSNMTVNLERGKVDTLAGGNHTGVQTNETIAVNVSGSSLGNIGVASQLMCGDITDGGSATATFNMTGGRVDDLRTGYYGSSGSLNCTVKGGNILNNALGSKSPLKDGSGAKLNPVSMVTKTADGSDLEYNLSGASSGNKDKGIVVTVNGSTWYSKLNENGILELQLPATSFSAGAIEVKVSGSKQYTSEEGTVLDGEVNSIELTGGSTTDSYIVNFGAEDKTTGSVTCSGKSEYTDELVAGSTSLTFNAAPESGYKLIGWWKNGTKLSAGSGVTISGNTLTITVNESMEIRAKFVLAGSITFGGSPIESCVVTAAYAGGTTTSSTTSAKGTLSGVEKGTAVTFTTGSKATGYEFVSWKVGGERVGGNEASYKWTANGAEALIEAEFVKKGDLRDLIAKAKPIYDGGTSAGTDKNYKATSAQDTEFRAAYDAAVTAVNATGIANIPTQDAIDTAKANLEAKLEPIENKIVIPEITGATITADPAYQKKGGLVTLTVDIDPGYALTANSVACKYTNIDGDEVTISPLTQGSGDDTNKYTFTMPDWGAIVNVSATVTASGSTVTYTTESADATKGTLKVKTKPDGLTDTTATANAKGSIASVKVTDSITFEAEAVRSSTSKSYSVAEWTVTPSDGATITHTDETDVNGITKSVCTLTKVSKDVTLTVSFKQNKHRITLSSGANGSAVIDATSGVEVDSSDGTYYVGLAGETVKLKATPTAGYEPVATYTKTEGSELKTKSITTPTPNADGTYTLSFTMPDEPTTVNVTFKEKALTVECVVANSAANGHGTLTAQKEDKSAYTTVTGNSNKYNVNFGEKVYIKPTPETGYKIKASTLNCKEDVASGTLREVTLTTETDGRYSFTMPEYPVKVTVEYELDPYAITTAMSKPSTDDNTNNPGKVTITVAAKTDAGSIAAPTTNDGTKAHYTNVVTVTATPWTLDGAAPNASATPAETADYVLDKITYRPTSSPAGTNETTITPDSGAYKFDMPAYPVTVTAHFIRLYKITDVTPADTTNPIEITAKVGETNVKTKTDTVAKVKPGDIVIFTTKQKGSTPSGLVVATTADNTDETLTPNDAGNFEWTMEAKDVTIKAKFTPNPFLIKVEAPATANTGSISVDPTGMAYKGKGKVTVTSKPATGYELDKLVVTSTTTGTPSTTTTEDVLSTNTAEATNSITGKKLTKKTGEGATDAAGHELYEFTINAMPPNDISVKPVFKRKVYDVKTSIVKPAGSTAADNTFGTFAFAVVAGDVTDGENTTNNIPNNATNGKAHYQNEVTLTVTSAAGKKLKSLVYNNGTDVTTDDVTVDLTGKNADNSAINQSVWDSTNSEWVDKYVYKFDMPASDVKFTATFEDIEYTITPKIIFAELNGATDPSTVTGFKAEDYLIITPNKVAHSDVANTTVEMRVSDTTDVKFKIKESTTAGSESPKAVIAGTATGVTVTKKGDNVYEIKAANMKTANIVVSVTLVPEGSTEGGTNIPDPVDPVTPTSLATLSDTPSRQAAPRQTPPAADPTPTATTAYNADQQAPVTTVSAANINTAITDAAANNSGQLVITASDVTLTADQQSSAVANKAVFSLPKDAVSAIVNATAEGDDSAKVNSLKLETPSGATAEFNSAAIAAIASAYGETENSNVEIVIQPATDGQKSVFGTQAESALDGKPVYSFEVKINGDKVTDFKNGDAGNGSVTLSIPYTLADGEVAENVKACYIPESGDVEPMSDSRFTAGSSANEGIVTFTTTHFSLYGVMYHEIPFTDITGHWAEQAIAAMELKGVVNGVTDTEFMPDKMLKRGMLVTMLGRMAGAGTEGVTDTCFADVPADAYYAPYMSWAKDSGIAQGTGDGMFSPEQPITREQLAVLLYRYTGHRYENAPKASSSEQFSDDEAISAWAKEAVYALRDADIINGMGDNKYNPRENATRAQVCTVIQRMLDKFENETVLA